MSILLRRRKLGRTSCREIAKYAQTGFKVIRNDKDVPEPKEKYLFRWGCVSDIPKGYEVINKSEGIHTVSDKAGFRKVLNEKELCPKTWFDFHELTKDYNPPHRRFDVVVRPRVHAQGRRIFRCRTPDELRDACNRCGPGYYISEFIDKVAEYRVFVCQGRAVWVAQKTPGNPGDLAWNVAKGGHFDNVNWDKWPLKAVKRSIEAHNLSGLDFSGVDVMVDRKGEVYILEINAAPSQTSPYRQQCVAKAFDYLVRNGRKAIPLVEEKGGYRKFIHPGVCENAIR